MRYLPACMLSLALLGGCRMGPDFVRPEVEAPQRFVGSDVLLRIEATDDAPLVEGVGQRWWEGFEAPALNDLVTEALAQSPPVLAAAHRLDAARAELARVDARDALVVTATGDNSAQARQRLNGQGDLGGANAGQLNVSWLPDIFGRTARRVERAQAQLDEADSALQGAALVTAAEVTRTWLTLLGTTRQRTLLEESVALQEQTLAIVRSRYEAGLSPELDLRRAESSVERLRADIPPLTETIINARQRLAVLAGQFPGATDELLDESAAVPAYRAGVTLDLPLVALTRRPDLRAAEARLKQAVAAIGVAEAEFAPLFTLGASVRLSRGGLGAVPFLSALTGALTSLVEQTIANGGARQATVEAARASAEAALADYRQALLTAAAEVEQTLTALAASLDRQASLDRAVAASTRSFEQAERLYQLGLSSFLDVVDAQRVRAAAEQLLASERTRYAVQLATLFEALGRAPEAGPGNATHEGA